MVGAPARAQRKRVVWRDDEQRSERALPCKRGKGYEACEEDAGPVLIFGISASVIYGIVFWMTTLF